MKYMFAFPLRRGQLKNPVFPKFSGVTEVVLVPTIGRYVWKFVLSRIIYTFDHGSTVSSPKICCLIILCIFCRFKNPKT